MKFELKDKIALVTGASSGIGREVALALAEKGAKVALVARNVQSLTKVKQQINDKGKVAELFPQDLTKLDEIPDLVEKIRSRFGGTVDLLVNNAGTAVLGLVENVPLDVYEDIFKINFFGPLALIQAVVPAMKEKGSGQIVNVTSGVGKRGLPGVSPYCATKFSLNALTESIRVELDPFGINVLSISPGLVSTEFQSRLQIFGELKETFGGEGGMSPVVVAQKIIEAVESSKRDVNLSLRSKIACHINYWVPALIDYILKRKAMSGFKPKGD
jgi:short-subunit dehydrogenase